MVFCSPNCRKSDFQKKDRRQHPRNSSHCPTKARDNYELFGSAVNLAEMYYTTPPLERLQVLKEVVDSARAGNTKMRSLLINKRILYPEKGETRMYYRRDRRNYRTIAQLADAYCKRLWGHGVKDVVYSNVPEPPTGEVMQNESVVTIRSHYCSMRKASLHRLGIGSIQKASPNFLSFIKISDFLDVPLGR